MISFLYHHPPLVRCSFEVPPPSGTVNAEHCSSYFGRLSGTEEPAWVISGHFGELCHPHFPHTGLSASLCFRMGVAVSGIFILCLCLHAHASSFPPKLCRAIFRFQLFKPELCVESRVLRGQAARLTWVSVAWDASFVFALCASACPAFLGLSGVQAASAQSALVSHCAFPPSMKPLWGWSLAGAESGRGCAVLSVCSSTVEPPFPAAPLALPCPELTQPTRHAPGEEQPQSHSSVEFRDE